MIVLFEKPDTRYIQVHVFLFGYICKKQVRVKSRFRSWKTVASIDSTSILTGCNNPVGETISWLDWSHAKRDVPRKKAERWKFIKIKDYITAVTH